MEWPALYSFLFISIVFQWLRPLNSLSIAFQQSLNCLSLALEQTRLLTAHKQPFISFSIVFSLQTLSLYQLLPNSLRLINVLQKKFFYLFFQLHFICQSLWSWLVFEFRRDIKLCLKQKVSKRFITGLESSSGKQRILKLLVVNQI